MAASLLPLHPPAAAAAAPRRPFLSPGTAARPLLLHRICPAATSDSSGRRNGGLEVRRCSAVVPRASAVRVSGLEEAEGKVCNGRVNPIVVIDNYDSFTYNLCQYMGELGANFEVYRNDELTVEEMKRKKPRGILISPGPGTPQDSGISLQTVLELGPSIPLFGVCMGLQCIGEAFGGKIVRSPHGVMHGKSSLVYHDEKGEDGLFSGLPNPFTAGRYHSLVIENDSFPHDVLEITAWTEDGLIMAARHKKYMHIQMTNICMNKTAADLFTGGSRALLKWWSKIKLGLIQKLSYLCHIVHCLLGVQFHPESIITTEGKTMVQNFIKLVERFEAESRNEV